MQNLNQKKLLEDLYGNHKRHKKETSQLLLEEALLLLRIRYTFCLFLAFLRYLIFIVVLLSWVFSNVALVNIIGVVIVLLVLSIFDAGQRNLINTERTNIYEYYGVSYINSTMPETIQSLFTKDDIRND
jgi:hypothetical protein